MSFDGALPLIVALVATVAATALTAVLWDRWRLPARAGAGLLVLACVAAAAGLQVNRLTEAYPDAPAPQGPETPEQAAAAGSQLLSVTVPGVASHLDLLMYVYLPAAYRTGTGRFPVIEATHGFPGSPRTWTRRLDVQKVLDTEIEAGRMAPTIVLFPTQTPRQLLDTECTDLRAGPRTETFLTQDVPAFARARYRVRTDRAGWGLTGYSAGGYCAINLLLRHPDQYAAGASMSGLSAPGIKIGDGTENTFNNAAWRLRHLPSPAVALWLGWAADDKSTRVSSTTIASLARAPMAVTTAVLAHGGHNEAVWLQMEGPAFDWLSAHLARPLPG
jgi:enterochelin esterase-like enzyme